MQTFGSAKKHRIQKGAFVYGAIIHHWHCSGASLAERRQSSDGHSVRNWLCVRLPVASVSTVRRAPVEANP